jgi:DNA repair protein RecN (Recombination protein N)
MLRRLLLRDVVIVAELEIDLSPGLTVLTGETGAGKSILIDALQLALGNRAEASLVREGAGRAEVSAEFDTPLSLLPWLEEAGFDAGQTHDGHLLLRRTVDASGKSRAWINGSPATLAQLREAADHLVDIHGQHAWQSLTRPAAVRALLDAQAGANTTDLSLAWQGWRAAIHMLTQARQQQNSLAQERDRLAWQIAEIDKLAPAAGEWDTLNAEHQRQANSQALLDGARLAKAALSDDDSNASALLSRAIGSLDAVHRYDAELGAVAEVLRAARNQLDDAAHTLTGYLGHREPDPQRLAELDARLGAWMALSKRYRRAPADLPALLSTWQAELKNLEAAADLQTLERQVSNAESVWREEATQISTLRRNAAPLLAAAVTQAMQQLGMAGGQFEVALLPQSEAQAFGLEAVELRVAGHAGSTPRALAKVASGGELSRLALAIAVTTAQQGDSSSVGTLIFDEIDAGVGGTVADSVGRLMKQLGRSCQVMAVTHLAQVAACADGHFVVSKAMQGTQTLSNVQRVEGEARVAEIARMLGGETLSGTAHAQTLLGQAAEPARTTERAAAKKSNKGTAKGPVR